MKDRFGMCFGFVVLVALLSLSLTGSTKSDETDPPGGRSGMGLYTDYGTGCQYLGFGSGSNGKALTPRIAADGKTHLGCKGAAK